jgi:hypothetical protein
MNHRRYRASHPPEATPLVNDAQLSTFVGVSLFALTFFVARAVNPDSVVISLTSPTPSF